MKWAWKMCNCTEIFREKKLTLLESPSRQMCVTTLPWFLPQCTKPGRNWTLGPAVQLLLKQKPVAGAANAVHSQVGYLHPTVLDGHRAEDLRSTLSCAEQLSWELLSLIQSLSLSHFIYKPSAFSSVQQSHVSWTLGNSPFHCTSIFLTYNILFSVCLQVNCFDRLILSFRIPVSVHCLPIAKYISYFSPLTILVSLQGDSSEHNYFHALKIRVSLH